MSGAATAMILAAGLGTRMEPLTRERAKPALRLFDHPLIAWPMAQLAAAGVERLVVNLHHLPQTLEPDLERYARQLGLRLSLSREPETILGTGGGLGAAAPLLLESGPSTMMMLNGDSLWFGDLPGAGHQHRTVGAEASMLLQPPPPGGRYGAVQTDREGRVVSIAGAPEPLEPPADNWMFIGIHIFEPALLERIPAGRPTDINGEVYRAMIRAGETVQGLPVAGPWLDFGTPRTFLSSALSILSDQAAGGDRYPLPLDLPGRVIGGRCPHYLGPGSRVAAGATVRSSVVGSSCDVGPDVSLTNCLVMEGCSIGHGVVLEDCLVGPHATLPDNFSAAGEVISRGSGERPQRRPLGDV